ncbi:Autoinducer 2 sensor kinase/phosphatase LuxQ [Rickettsia endosymbiont of Cardiosporidium cionae]|nr:Autoinducer 2 sensor kinase/phosphatase LuxQ [Rickettsia endosymbiont of Cardiosporidium cionae]
MEKELHSKNVFLDNLSHELRIPIQGVTAISKGLIEHWPTLDNNKRLKLVAEISDNASKLFSLANNLLDMSKMHAGKMLYNMQQHDLYDTVKLVIGELKTLYMKNSHLKIKIVNNCKVKTITAFDHDRIAQVLRNLISNAIKFTHEGDITITLSRTSYKPRHDIIMGFKITVCDTGIGIPTKDLSKIFSSFTQSSRTDSWINGTGLGLSISAEIVIAHHGKIWAENNKNRGASFSFILPAREQKNIDNLSKSTCDKVIKKSKGKYHLLLVDDSEACLISIQLILKSSKYTVTCMTNGKEALEYLDKHFMRVDLILLDLIIPDMYGLDILATIKKQSSKFSHIPVIIQSGMINTSEINLAYSVGAAKHILKPYSKEEIIDCLDEVINHN